MKLCSQCGYENKDDSSYCRSCGEELVDHTEPPMKEKVQFIPRSSPKTEDNLCFGEESSEGGWIIGAVFIVVGLFISIFLLWPDFVGTFFEGFGEFWGHIGSDIGTFFGNWGSAFGQAVGGFFTTLFSETNIWLILRIVIPGIFILIGIIQIVNYVRKR